MILRKMFLKALLTLALFAVVILPALADHVPGETKNASGVYGITWHDDGAGVYKSLTTSQFVAPYLYVNIRAWGNPPNNLKDQKTAEAYNSQSTATVHVADIYGLYIPSRHLANTQYGGVELYTSVDTCRSNWCSWNYGTTASCPQTC